MKKISIVLLSIFLFLGTGFTKKYPHGNGVYQINTQTSKLAWKGEKLTGEHSGTIQLKSGTISMESHLVSKGSFIMDMGTLICTDLKGESKEDLENHLKSDDFFGVKRFPESQFVITGCTPLPGDDKGNNCTIKGTLTIKGITNEINFPASISIAGDVLAAKAELKFDRTKWAIKYKSKSIFDDLGDKFIYDDITMVLNISADLVH